MMYKRILYSVMAMSIIAALMTTGNYYRQQLSIATQTADALKRVVAVQNDEIERLHQKLSVNDKQIVSLKQALEMATKDNTWNMQNGIATAYSPHDNKSGIEAGSDPNLTSIGLHPGNGVIAVDPSKIPYKSEMLVIYPDGHTYSGIAGDTGGALRMSRGVHIDIYKDTYAETEKHGVQNVIILWRPKKSTS